MQRDLNCKFAMIAQSSGQIASVSMFGTEIYLRAEGELGITERFYIRCLLDFISFHALPKHSLLPLKAIKQAHDRLQVT